MGSRDGRTRDHYHGRQGKCLPGFGRARQTTKEGYAKKLKERLSEAARAKKAEKK